MEIPGMMMSMATNNDSTNDNPSNEGGDVGTGTPLFLDKVK